MLILKTKYDNKATKKKNIREKELEVFPVGHRSSF